MAQEPQHEPGRGQSGQRPVARDERVPGARHDLGRGGQRPDRALELLTEHEVPEALRGPRHRVVERRLHRRAQGEVRIDRDGHDRDRRRAGEDEPPSSPQDARLDEQHVRRDAGREQERERVVAERQPEDDRRREQPGAGAPRRLCLSADAASRRRHSNRSTSRSAARKMWSACASARWPTRHATGRTANATPVRSPSAARRVSWTVATAPRAAAPATRSAERRSARYASLPNGWSTTDASHASSV